MLFEGKSLDRYKKRASLRQTRAGKGIKKNGLNKPKKKKKKITWRSWSKPVGGGATAIADSACFSVARRASRMVDSGYSKKCPDLRTRWDGNKCVACKFKPGECPEPWLSGAMCRCLILHFYVVAGHEVSPNCGYDDHGGRHDVPFKKCQNNTFSDGTSASCHPCTVCHPGDVQLSPCNATTDTQCSTRWVEFSVAAEVNDFASGQYRGPQSIPTALP